MSGANVLRLLFWVYLKENIGRYGTCTISALVLVLKTPLPGNRFHWQAVPEIRYHFRKACILR